MSVDNEGVLYTGEHGKLLTGFMAQEPRVLSPNGNLTPAAAPTPRVDQPFQISRPELGGSASSADVSHYSEWIWACHGGPPASANYEFEAPIAESLMLGNIAIRTRQALEWDTTSFHLKRGSQVAQDLLMPPRSLDGNLGTRQCSIGVVWLKLADWNRLFSGTWTAH
jgi:hypothetical protein